MIRPRKHLRMALILGSAALVAAGCGGGDDAAVDAGTGAAPVPGGEPVPGGVVGNDGTTPAATDPTTGQPIDPAAGGGVTATIPDLVGGDVGGGLGSLDGSSIFSAKAGSSDEVAEADTSTKSDNLDPAPATSDPATSTNSAPAFSGAKIYVDGVVHDVTRGGSFPQGSPVFRLVTVTASDIEIELIAGEFTSGGGTGIVLDKGDLESLVNQSEQLTYRIKYLRGITSTSGVAF